MVILHYFLRLTTNMVQYIMEYFVQLPLRHLHHSPPQSWCHTLTMQTADLSDGAPRNHNMLSPLLTNQMKPLVGVNLLLFVRVWAEGSPRPSSPSVERCSSSSSFPPVSFPDECKQMQIYALLSQKTKKTQEDLTAYGQFAIADEISHVYCSKRDQNRQCGNKIYFLLKSLSLICFLWAFNFPYYIESLCIRMTVSQ